LHPQEAPNGVAELVAVWFTLILLAAQDKFPLPVVGLFLAAVEAAAVEVVPQQLALLLQALLEGRVILIFVPVEVLVAQLPMLLVELMALKILLL
jgi:hypothetical protein